jgi:signal transduction histidine kinase
MLQLTLIKHLCVTPFSPLLSAVAMNNKLYFIGVLVLLVFASVMVILFLISKSNKEKKLLNEINNLNTEIAERTKILEKALQRAEEANRLKSLFLANMSHEIRTPLNSIMGFSELLVDDGLSTKQKELFAAQVIQNGKNLLRLIDQIFHLAIFETGKVNISKEEFKVSVIFESLRLKTEKKIQDAGKNIILIMNVENDDYLIKTDKLKLKLILNNLLDNAVKFTQKGVIDVSCVRTENEYLFQVSDSGCGLNETEYDIIFDPFTQGSETLKKIKGGSGLGLSNVKNYVILLGGKIWCARNFPSGSVFNFTLPAKRIKEEELIQLLSASFYNN